MSAYADMRPKAFSTDFQSAICWRTLRPLNFCQSIRDLSEEEGCTHKTLTLCSTPSKGAIMHPIPPN